MGQYRVSHGKKLKYKTLADQKAHHLLKKSSSLIHYSNASSTHILWSLNLPHHSFHTTRIIRLEVEDEAWSWLMAVSKHVLTTYYNKRSGQFHTRAVLPSDVTGLSLYKPSFSTKQSAVLHTTRLKLDTHKQLTRVIVYSAGHRYCSARVLSGNIRQFW